MSNMVQLELPGIPSYLKWETQYPSQFLEGLEGKEDMYLDFSLSLRVPAWFGLWSSCHCVRCCCPMLDMACFLHTLLLSCTSQNTVDSRLSVQVTLTEDSRQWRFAWEPPKQFKSKNQISLSLKVLQPPWPQNFLTNCPFSSGSGFLLFISPISSANPLSHIPVTSLYRCYFDFPVSWQTGLSPRTLKTFS